MCKAAHRRRVDQWQVGRTRIQLRLETKNFKCRNIRNELQGWIEALALKQALQDESSYQIADSNTHEQQVATTTNTTRETQPVAATTTTKKDSLATQKTRTIKTKYVGLALSAANIQPNLCK